jgi:hypothetical protein
MSTQTDRPPLRQGDLVRFIYDRDHVETVESCEWVATPIMLSAARRESLRICEQAFARRNPELFEKLNAEFEGMTDAELAVIARWPHRWQVVTNWPGNRRVADAAEFLIERGRAMGTDGFGEIEFADRYGADVVTEAGVGLENPVELWRRYQQAFALFNALAEPGEEDEATFHAVVDEIERIATNQIPTALEGVLLRLRLIQQSQETTVWGEFEDELIARAIEGLEAMAAGEG